MKRLYAYQMKARNWIQRFSQSVRDRVWTVSKQVAQRPIKYLKGLKATFLTMTGVIAGRISELRWQLSLVGWYAWRRWVLRLAILILFLALLGIAIQLLVVPQTRTASSKGIVMTVSCPPIASTGDTSRFHVSILNASTIPVTPTVGFIYTSTQTSHVYTSTQTIGTQTIKIEDIISDSGYSSFIRFPSLLSGERRTEEIVLRINSRGLKSHLLANFVLFLNMGQNPKQPDVEMNIPITILDLWLPLGIGNISQHLSWLWIFSLIVTVVGMLKTILELKKSLRGAEKPQGER